MPEGRSLRWLAWGGLIGPAVFVTDWAVLGAIRAGYSPIHDAISRLAERGASTQPTMTGGFVVYGIGLAGFGIALRTSVSGPAGLLAVGTGVATLGVAAAPLGSPKSDTAHAIFAACAYACLAGIPVAMARTAITRGRRARLGPAELTGLLIGALLLVSATVDSAHGLTQRLGLTLGDAWVALCAAELLFQPRRELA